MKKTTYFTALFFLLTTIAFSQEAIDWEAVKARYVEKYQPTEIPQWLFPLIFENGDGERDTIYLGFDVDSGGSITETKYGEEYTPIDSSSFQAYWYKCPNSICDTQSVIDVNVSPIANGDIFFRNGKLPITLYFNGEYFDSDSIYMFDSPDSPPYVQGQISQYDSFFGMGRWNKDLEEWEDFCSWGHTIILRDTTLLCSWVSDSLHIHKSNPDSPIYELEGLMLTTEKWNGWLYTSTEEKLETRLLSPFPNPSDHSFSFELPEAVSGQWQLYNLAGAVVSFEGFNAKRAFKVDTHHLENGLYVLVLKTESERGIGKVLVWH